MSEGRSLLVMQNSNGFWTDSKATTLTLGMKKPIVVIKRLAGIAPEVNLRIPLHSGDEVRKLGIHPGFETQSRRRQKSKTGVSVAPQKGLMSFTFVLKKKVVRILP